MVQQASNQVAQWYINIMYISVWMETVVTSVLMFIPYFFLCPQYTFWALIFPEFGKWMWNSASFEGFFRGAKMTTIVWRWFFMLFGADLYAEGATAWLVYLFWISLPSNFLWGVLVLLVPPIYVGAEMLVQYAYPSVEPFMWQ